MDLEMTEGKNTPNETDTSRKEPGKFRLVLLFETPNWMMQKNIKLCYLMS